MLPYPTAPELNRPSNSSADISSSDDAPTSILSEISLGPPRVVSERQTGLSGEKASLKVRGNATSLKDWKCRPINLLSCNSRDIELIKDSKRTAIVPFEYGKEREAASSEEKTTSPHSSSFTQQLCARSVYATLSPDAIKNASYISFLQKVLEQKKREYGANNKMAQEILGIKALLTDGLTLDSLPSEIKGLFNKHTIAISKNLNHKQIATFLEGRDSERFKKVENAVNELYAGPCQKIFATPCLNAQNMDRYLERSFDALMEVFDDPGSYPRQQLLQLLHLPNVRTVRHESSIEAKKVCIEIQPNTLEDYVAFMRHYHCGQFQSMLGSNVKVNSQPFIGRVDMDIDVASAMQVLRCFCPTLVQMHSHELRSLIRDGNLEGLCVKIESNCQPDAQSKKVMKLGEIAATRIYKNFLERNDLSPYEYLKILKDNGCPHHLDEIRSMHGYNALHLAIKLERDDFMKMLFYNNNWGHLRNDVVVPLNNRQDSLHAGYTPRRLAEAFSYRTRGFDMLNKYDRLDLLIRQMSPVSKACLGGSLESVSALVETHSYLMEVKDDSLSHCLFYACASGNAKLVEYLLRKGVPRDVVNRKGEMPLHFVAMFGHLDVFRIFLEFMNTFKLAGNQNKYGYGAIHYCAMYGDIEALKFYQENNIKIDPKALTTAAKHRRWKAFDFILKEYTKEKGEVNNGKNDEDRTAVHYSVLNGYAAGLKVLFEKGACIRAMDKYKKSLLHLAAEHKQTETLRVLINEAKQNECLQDMISTHDTYVGRDLLVVVRGKDRGRKAWHWVELKRLSALAFKQAMATGQVDVINYGRILISGFGSGPDHKAQKDMAKRTNDIFNDDKPDMTPLHFAAFRNSPEVVQILLENGANPNAVDSIGATPMHYAAMNNSITIIQTLQSFGGSCDVQTLDGKTPFAVAEENMNALAINFLKSNEPMGKAKVFVDDVLTSVGKDLDEEKLEKQREKGNDVRRLIIDSLRGLTIDINKLLMDLGSGPVQEASQDESAYSTH